MSSNRKLSSMENCLGLGKGPFDATTCHKMSLTLNVLGDTVCLGIFCGSTIGQWGYKLEIITFGATWDNYLMATFCWINELVDTKGRVSDKADHSELK